MGAVGNMKYSVKTVKNIINNSKLGCSANPYGGCPHRCIYCYAQYMPKFSGHDNEHWGDYIDVKYWNNVSVGFGKNVVIGTATDPYMECEKTYCRTNALLQQLLGVPCSVMIITKSDLVVRDIELLKQLKCTVAISINTLDENVKDAQDSAPSVQRRLQALQSLYESGVHTQLMCAPVFPEITDVYALFDESRQYVDAFCWDTLNLRSSDRKAVVSYINMNYPGLSRLYYEIYNLGNQSYWNHFDDMFRKYVVAADCTYGVPPDFNKSKQGYPAVYRRTDL